MQKRGYAIVEYLGRKSRFELWRVRNAELGEKIKTAGRLKSRAEAEELIKTDEMIQDIFKPLDRLLVRE